MSSHKCIKITEGLHKKLMWIKLREGIKSIDALLWELLELRKINIKSKEGGKTKR